MVLLWCCRQLWPEPTLARTEFDLCCVFVCVCVVFVCVGERVCLCCVGCRFQGFSLVMLSAPKTALPENRPSRELPFPRPPSPCVECDIVLADHAPEAGLAPGIFHEISRQTPWQKSGTCRNGLEEEITCTALMG